jgi:hypothetical protein
MPDGTIVVSRAVEHVFADEGISPSVMISYRAATEMVAMIVDYIFDWTGA